MTKLQNALAIAEGIVTSLTPHTSKIQIAGSCRRQKPEVKDIEIICLPKKKIIRDVFGETSEGGRTKDFVACIESLGAVIKGSSINGKQMQIKLPSDIALDLFMPDDFDYYRTLAMRTGSAVYSREVIAYGWRKIGWCGVDGKLRREKDCVAKISSSGEKSWKCINNNPELPPVWKSEQEFFDWIKVRWVEPSQRYV